MPKSCHYSWNYWITPKCCITASPRNAQHLHWRKSCFWRCYLRFESDECSIWLKSGTRINLSWPFGAIKWILCPGPSHKVKLRTIMIRRKPNPKLNIDPTSWFLWRQLRLHLQARQKPWVFWWQKYSLIQHFPKGQTITD